MTNIPKLPKFASGMLREIAREQSLASNIYREPFFAVDMLREIAREQSLASNIYREPFFAVDMLREIARQQSRSLEMVHKHLHSLNSFSELKRKIAATETWSLAESYRSAVTLTKFYSTGITHSSVQDFLQKQNSLSEQVENLMRTSDFLTTHNILIPTNPADIVDNWLDEQLEQEEESSSFSIALFNRPVFDKKKLPSFNFEINVRNWIGNTLAILALAQGCANEENTEKTNLMLEKALIEISELKSDQNAENKNLILGLGDELAKQSTEDRAFFLSVVREEIQRIQDELDDEVPSESDEEAD